MNKLIALCSFALSLYGCDVGDSTFVHRVTGYGADTLYSTVTAQSGVARFDCLSSASGQCYYTLFPRDCAAPRAHASAGKRSAYCAAPVERFVVAQGDSRQVPGLPRFRPCVSAQAATPRPDCAVPTPVAAL